MTQSALPLSHTYPEHIGVLLLTKGVFHQLDSVDECSISGRNEHGEQMVLKTPAADDDDDHAVFFCASYHHQQNKQDELDHHI